MIKVDVKDAKQLINSISKLLSSYKEKHRQIEHEYNNMISNWKNNKNPSFFALVNENQLLNIKLISMMQNEIKTINRVLNKYDEIGNKIECDLQKQEYIMAKLDSIKEKINKINIKFNELDNISSYNNYFKILELKNNVLKQDNNITNLKDKINNKYQYIKSLEKDISSIVTDKTVAVTIKNNLNYSSKKYTDYYEFNIEKVRLSNQRLKSYFNDQKNIIEDINTNFNKLDNHYKSSNIDRVINYNSKIVNQMKKVRRTNMELYNKVVYICDDYEHMLKENISNWERL